MRGLAPLILILLAAGAVGAQTPRDGDAASLAEARREAAAAETRSRALERQARRATSAAERARAESAALAARIEAAEADLTAAERRIAIIATLQEAQRARVAERQQPVVRLTAALQTMARRPAALALVRPGSVRDTVHVRSLLAVTLPEIRRRTASLRAEVDRGNQLRRQAEDAHRALAGSREQLRQRRVALAAFEVQQRSRSAELSGLAMTQSDRALAFGEEARALAGQVSTRQFQARLEASLQQLPGPVPRPRSDAAPAPPRLSYLLPVEGRLVTGVGEISDGGVHARGLVFETAPQARVVAPAAGRIVYAAPFRSYGEVVIIDHGRGWSTVITDLAGLRVAEGQAVRRGTLLGRAGADARVSVELRREGRPVPVAQIISG